MLSSYNFADAQKLLIKPFERVRFVITFVMTTILGQILAYFIILTPAFYLLWERSPMQYGIATGIVTGMFNGLFFVSIYQVGNGF